MYPNNLFIIFFTLLWFAPHPDAFLPLTLNMSFQQRLTSALNSIQAEASKSQFLGRMEQQTGVSKSYQLGGFAGVYLLMVFLNVGGIGQLFANLAAVALPGYYSLKALETPGSRDDTQFLTYWVVYAALSIIEFWSSFILYWIPFYWFFKTIVFLYLGLPHFNGSQMVYDNVLRPFSVKVLGIRPNAAENLREKASATTTGAR